MKTETRVMDVTSTLEGEKVQMGIDQTALAHIMSVLTDLYSDPVMAVIREYSTNAFDAHIQAGQTRPIEVTTPSSFAPFFKVQDFGIGLSADDIRDIYSQYGASTKRDSNDVVGMLGLGCKSALTYTDQFTLSSVKDGVCTQVSISRDEDGGGSMTIVAQYETDEPNGTTVIVPVKSSHDFEMKSNSFFRFWQEGTVLVNGKTPQRIDGIWLTDKIVMSRELESSVIVMGNVAYPYDDGEYSYRHEGKKTASFVNIGDVNFTPSREALQMTPRTKATIETVKATVKREKQAAFKRQIDAATTHSEALKTYYEVDALGYEEKNPQWNGTTIPVQFESDDPKNPYSFLAASGHRGGKGQRQPKLYTKSVVQESYRWFEGFTASELSPYKRKKLDKWCADNGVSTPRMWIMMDAIPADVKPWLDATRIHNWADVEAIKLPANGPRQDGRPTGSYDTIQGVEAMGLDGKPVTPKRMQNRNVGGVLAADLDTSKPMYWVTKQEYYSPYLNLINKIDTNGYTVVLLGLNRVKKFNRDFPNAIRLRDAVSGLVKKWEDTLTDDDKLYLNVQNSPNSDLLAKLDAKKLDDPDLADAARVAKINNNDLRTAYSEFSSYTTLDFSAWTCPTLKYPLLDSMGYYQYNKKTYRDHITIYVNAAFAAEQENN